MVSASAGVFVVPDGLSLERSDDIMDYIVTCSQMAKNGGKDSIVSLELLQGIAVGMAI